MAKNNLVEITSQLYGLLEPLNTEDRKRAVNAVLVLLGDSPIVPTFVSLGSESQVGTLANTPGLGAKATQWIKQHKLTHEILEKCFYFQNGKADIHLNTIIGAGYREQTSNCYLLIGAKAFLESDNAVFSEADAIALCKHTGAYDKNNHTTHRKNLGMRIAGSRENGFSLTGPGIKAAAELIMEIGTSS